jgi:tetratricopeptide (TPR) repeat protein
VNVTVEMRLLTMKRCNILLLLLTAGVLLTGCNKSVNDGPDSQPVAPSACAVALTPHKGSEPIDLEITRLQTEARDSTEASRLMERLGWTFVQKARLSYDPGYYKLAEACAACIGSSQQDAPEALLLRGHVLNSLHRFKEAEAVARILVTTRGLPFDYGLLGDALMEQGALTEAIGVYQKMIDMKPGPQSYSRAAHVRWLKGDLSGAIELMRMAAAAGGPRDGESAAWAYSRLANYELQAGSMKKARQACEAALILKPDYAPALLVRGRILAAGAEYPQAIELLKRAAQLNPLPEYQWALADAFRISGRAEEANRVENDLIRGGEAGDPRTFALYLATRRERTDQAVELARRELETRTDVFTLDALAWSLAASGRNVEAQSRITEALAEGTADARLFYHAGMIAALNRQKSEARQWLNKASSIKQMLMPSEREQLSKQLAAL